MMAPTNLANFFTMRNSTLFPVINTFAAVKAYGTPAIFCVEDNVSGIKFQDNQGDGGSFTVIGTAPQGYGPGPERRNPIIGR